MLSKLSGTIGMAEIISTVFWALESPENRERLFQLAMTPEAGKAANNALWCLTHLQKTDSESLLSKQEELIDRLLAETQTARKRMLLQILRDQRYDPEAIRTDFLDFCFGKINSECEPYAIRAFSIYCAFNLSRYYPELIAELEQHLDLLATQPLSPGLLSALRTTRRNIRRLHSR